MRPSTPTATAGWRTVETESGLKVAVRLMPDDRGELVVRDLHLTSPRRITAADLRDLSLSRIEAIANLSQPPHHDRPVLPRPDGTDPDRFYAQVAEVYRVYVTESSRPAVTMAAASGVPVGTARRWIAEARRRGHLPAGNRGRAG